MGKLGTATNGMKISHNSLLKSGLLNSLPCMIDSPNRIQRTRRFHTVFFSVPSVPFVVPWCSTRDSRLAAKPIIDAAQDSRKLLRFQRLSLTSCHSGQTPIKSAPHRILKRKFTLLETCLLFSNGVLTRKKSQSKIRRRLSESLTVNPGCHRLLANLLPAYTAKAHFSRKKNISL